ncbi:hypothetical protein QJS10_CPA09g01971 [Acorus calamus]|uniref:Uncharacterized protein n=1 Tax=Acorus calamus TaxID=4465 RepID=A0AAV9E5I1_ACOCL|nr:hypothetical protein QJS10_CPA09g01971 [Acorus calamus]
MGEAEKYSRIINPFIFHLQKLELEIKCPVCHCILNVEDDLRCPLCNMSHVHQDMQCSSNRLMNSNTADVTSQMDLMKNMNGEKYSRIINPLKFHLQKLELELKCPVCHCILNIENDLRCLLCQMSHTRQDLRLMSRLQNIVSIFKNMNAIFHVSDTQWLSNRRTNSNTADVIPQMGLVNNRNGKRPRGRPKKRFLDNEPNQASVQPATDVKTVEKCKDGETCNRELNLLAQSQGNTPPLSNSKDSDDNDNNVGFTGYMVFANIILIDRLLITRLRKKRKRLDVVHKKCTTPKIQGSTRPPYSTQKGSSEMVIWASAFRIYLHQSFRCWTRLHQVF